MLERRVDQHDMEAAGPRQKIRETGGVVPRALSLGEQSVEKARAARRQLVKSQGAAAGFRQHSQQSRAGGGLQHPIPRPHLGGQHRHGA